ncbi:hypothetical protein M3O96_06255 [Aquiflexum sp. TKW24L]|uniref:hypothetical protein n=1 Tax=Aquiflexum sp. TKW24L TaxID=2942212 RepID=UPI0020BD6167|nr:hypothetical protein [Aquiflexum sp. TKW24L]MCL6258680.1 hypothetical protein [Aquiflexum sp. TKW24L]
MTGSLFLDLENICEQLAKEIIEANTEENQIPIKVERTNAFEFVFRIGGDALIFILQSNIVRLPDENYLSKSKYLKDDVSLRYFGQVLIYNFLSDTIEFGRLDDPGYLIGRILLNRENKFFLEGDRKIVFNFPELKENTVNPDKMRDFVEQLVVSALENDLLAPAFGDIMVITYQQKIEHISGLGNPQKIGFDFFAKNKDKG